MTGYSKTHWQYITLEVKRRGEESFKIAVKIPAILDEGQVVGSNVKVLSVTTPQPLGEGWAISTEEGS